MHACSFCKDPVPAFDVARKAHLVVAKMHDDSIHTHGDLDQKDLMQELMDAAGAEMGLSAPRQGQPPAEVVFHNRQRIGDVLMFTCGIRDFKAAFPQTKVGVISTAMHLWDHNPAIDRSLRVKEFEVKAHPKNALTELSPGRVFARIGPGRLTTASNRLDWHFANAYRMSIESTLNLSIPQGLSRPDIWMTREEYDAPRLIADPYWIISVNGEKGWGCKMWPFERWQQVVSDNPELLFVQIGNAGDQAPRLRGTNVVDYIGKTEDGTTGIRDLFKLFLNAEGSLGLVSFHMHLSGALWKPAIVVAGAREPVSFTRYPGHAYLSNDGMLPCAVEACWHCDIKACTNLVDAHGQPVTLPKEHPPYSTNGVMPKCAELIDPDDVTRALRGYYRGGRCVKGQPSAKPRQFRNIVATPVQVAVAAPVRPAEPVLPDVSKYGMSFNGTSISRNDWLFLREVLAHHKVKTVLEFGAGLSSVLMSQYGGVQVTTYETDPVWAKTLKDLNLPNLYVRMWDGKTLQLTETYDLAFIDGPANGENREHSTRIAATAAPLVIQHDARRPFELKWEEQYLKGGGLEGPTKGGSWCHLWVKPGCQAPVGAPQPRQAAPGEAICPPNGKLVKIVSTARGWGGAGRSVTTIMRLLLERGYRVEFIPFRHQISSGEWQGCLKNVLAQVQVTTSFDTLREACDVLLVYADDFVWEFPKLAEAFDGLNARRKVMMLNYRRGKVGELPWTRGWDRYMFLNSNQEKELLAVLPGVQTQVLPPCTDLSAFFAVTPRYDAPIRVVRHNSQGDTKFCADNADQERVKREFAEALSRTDLEISMLPGPGFIPTGERFFKVNRTGDVGRIADFLSTGSLFWYSLPPGYMDMGPRVILEAMAAGLPILADPWGGAVDRVTPECGWLVSKEEQLQILKRVTPEELAAKGAAARARALTEFVPERWMDALVGV